MTNKIKKRSRIKKILIGVIATMLAILIYILINNLIYHNTPEMAVSDDILIDCGEVIGAKEQDGIWLVVYSTEDKYGLTSVAYEFVLEKNEKYRIQRAIMPLFLKLRRGENVVLYRIDGKYLILVASLKDKEEITVEDSISSEFECISNVGESRYSKYYRKVFFAVFNEMPEEYTLVIDDNEIKIK